MRYNINDNIIIVGEIYDRNNKRLKGKMGKINEFVGLNTLYYYPVRIEVNGEILGVNYSDIEPATKEFKNKIQEFIK